MSGGNWATFLGAAKPFCPCDAGRPEDCKPEEWPGAHAPSRCERCGAPSYQHMHIHDGLHCRDPQDPRYPMRAEPSR